MSSSEAIAAEIGARSDNRTNTGSLSYHTNILLDYQRSLTVAADAREFTGASISSKLNLHEDISREQDLSLYCMDKNYRINRSWCSELNCELQYKDTCVCGVGFRLCQKQRERNRQKEECFGEISLNYV